MTSSCNIVYIGTDIIFNISGQGLSTGLMEKLKPILKGAVQKIPGLSQLFPKDKKTEMMKCLGGKRRYLYDVMHITMQCLCQYTYLWCSCVTDFMCD